MLSVQIELMQSVASAVIITVNRARAWTCVGLLDHPEEHVES